MANEVKVTFFFQGIDVRRAVGWSESLYYAPGGDDLTNALQAAGRLGKLRAQFLGKGYQLNFIRASREGVYRDSRILQAGYAGTFDDGIEGDAQGDFAFASLLVRMESDEKNRRSMYVSGNSDALQAITGAVLDAKIKKAFDSWSDQVKLFWGYLGLVKAGDTNRAARVFVPPVPPATVGKYTYPNGKRLYTINNIIPREIVSRRRGRPFNLSVGRRKRPKPPHA